MNSRLLGEWHLAKTQVSGTIHRQSRLVVCSAVWISRDPWMVSSLTSWADAVGGLDEVFGLGEKDSYQDVTGPEVLSSGPTVTTNNHKYR
jgi:hypothetical protein